MVGMWDARVRFDVARRDVEPPPPISDADRAMFDMALDTALEKLAGNDATACRDYCRTALRILPDDVDALAVSAFAYLTLGYLEEGLRHAEAVLAKEPNNVYGLVGRLWVSHMRGDAQGMQRDLVRAVLLFRVDPEKWTRLLPPSLAADLWLLYGVGGVLLGRFDAEVIAAFDRVLAMDAADAGTVTLALTLRGSAHLVRGSPEMALRDLDDAVALAQELSTLEAYVRVIRASALAGVDRPEDAEADYRWILAAEGVPAGHGGGHVERPGDAVVGTRRRGAAKDAYRQGYALEGATGACEPRPRSVSRDSIGTRARNAAAIRLYSEALDQGGIQAVSRAWALSERAVVQRWKGDMEVALAGLDEALAVVGAVPQVPELPPSRCGKGFTLPGARAPRAMRRTRTPASARCANAPSAGCAREPGAGGPRTIRPGGGCEGRGPARRGEGAARRVAQLPGVRPRARSPRPRGRGPQRRGAGRARRRGRRGPRRALGPPRRLAGPGALFPSEEEPASETADGAWAAVARPPCAPGLGRVRGVRGTRAGPRCDRSGYVPGARRPGLLGRGGPGGARPDRLAPTGRSGRRGRALRPPPLPRACIRTGRWPRGRRRCSATIGDRSTGLDGVRGIVDIWWSLS